MDHKLSTGHGKKSGTTLVSNKKEAASRGTGSMEEKQSGTTLIGHKKEAASRGAGGIEARLGDLAVEVVFPKAFFIRLRDDVVSRNEERIRCVRDREIHEERGRPPLIAGSQVEGVAMQPNWGHPEADLDHMNLYGGALAVGVDGPGQWLPPGDVKLMYRGEGCPPAYARLEVVDADRLVEAINRDPRRNREVPAHTCVQEEGGRQWLHSRHLLDAMRPTHHPTVQGPAAEWPGSLREWVTALVGTGPHPDMAAYSQRPRTGWPSLKQLQHLLMLPMLLVCVGPKGHPDTGRLFRVSTSLHEMSLITYLEPWMKQGYICFKYILKALLRRPLASSRQGSDDGRSRVGSYHLKTVFLWFLEEHPPQPEGSPYNLTLNLCRKLQQCLVNRNIHNYFIPHCNLLEQVEEREHQEALSAVDKVLHNPIAAIIGSPVNPEEIFGSCDRQDDLLRCFRAVSDQPARGAAQEALQQLLRDLDEHRVRRYSQQLERDGRKSRFRVSGRPGLVRLADCVVMVPGSGVF